MKLVRLACVLVLVASAACTAATSSLGAPPPLIPRATLFGNPERGVPKISPDGSHVAFTAPADGVMNVFVAPVGDLAHPVQVTFDRTRPINQWEWSGDGAYVLYLQDQAGDENFHVYRVGRDGQGAADLTPGDKVRGQILSVPAAHPEAVLLESNARNPEVFDVYEVELATGKTTLKVTNPGFAGFVTDEDLRVRLAEKMEADGTTVVLKAKADGSWGEIDRVGQEDSLTTGVLSFDASGTRYYMRDSRGRDTGALFEVDAGTGKRELLAEHAHADAGEVLLHPVTGLVRAVRFDHARKAWKVLDQAIEADLAALAKVDEGDAFVTSMTTDDRRWLVAFAGDRRPLRFYLWDRDKQAAAFLYAQRPELEKLELARMHPVTIRARDGLDLVSYLSVPVNADPDGDGNVSESVPMVLLVHGGPWGRVSWGYNAYAQLLTNRGYAVLMMNFRASTGFGKRFVNAGDREWGKKMHDDLLDGVAWAVAAGVTTADRVCIMGGSYGGYATLAGLTLTPTAFRCGVDIVGPSNLETLLGSFPPYWQPVIAMFKTRVGDPGTPEGKALLQAASPLHHAGAIARPLLIGQGANDPRVKRAESDQIVDAMKQKGLPVTYVLFPDEGHGFQRPENNLAFTAVTEAFLAVHLGGRAQAMTAADFTGSTIQVLAGREGIRGLPASVGVPPPASTAPAPAAPAVAPL